MFLRTSRRPILGVRAASPNRLLCEFLEPPGGSGRFASLARFLGFPGSDASTLGGVVPALDADVRAAMLFGDVRLRIPRGCRGDHAVVARERTRADKALRVLCAGPGEILRWGQRRVNAHVNGVLRSLSWVNFCATRRTPSHEVDGGRQVLGVPGALCVLGGRSNSSATGQTRRGSNQLRECFA
jgi:hypothetical protein